MSEPKPKLKMKWRKVSAPKVWHPKPGEELIGYYMGRTKRDGSFGQYEVVTVAVPYHGVFSISGTMLIQLMDASLINRGEAVRVVFVGRKELEGERELKVFELYVGEAESIDETEMPEIHIEVES